MPFFIVRNDITKMQVDAIVNAAKPSLLGGGGVDGAIHAAAGPELLEECKTLGGCEVGQAKITKGYRLPARYVIHTVGPRWHGGLFGEKRKLLSCYRSSLELAAEQGLESVAFPLISSGAYGYPKDKALESAREAIESFLLEQDMTVYLVVYGEESLAASRQVFDDVREYIDREYVREHPYRRNRREELDLDADFALFSAEEAAPQAMAPMAAPKPGPKPKAAEKPANSFQAPMASAAAPGWRFGQLDESFQQMLLRKIDEKGMTDAQCYKKANVDRKLFSKIRGDVHYSPSKKTAIAFAIALELDLAETRELLMKAGYALSPSNMFDVIVEYFISLRHYNIFEINEALFAYDQITLG